MEAKDTVMSWERIRMVFQEQDKKGITDNMFRLEAIDKAQDAISFKAGYNDGFEFGWETGKKAARREVVDYFFYEAGIVALMGCRTMDECLAKLPNWQAKLKDWGIEVIAER